MPASLTDTSTWIAAPVGPAAGDPRTAASVTGPLSSLNQRIRFLLWFLGQINGNFASGSPSPIVSVVGNNISCTSHGFSTTSPLRFQIGASGGGLPTPLDVDTVYFAINVDANTFQVSATSGGGAISLGSGFGGDVYALFVVDSFSEIFAPAEAPYPAGNLRSALATTVATSVLGSQATGSSGSRLVGVEAITGSVGSFSTETLYAALEAIANGVAWLGAATANQFTGNITVLGVTTCSGALSVSGALGCAAITASSAATFNGIAAFNGTVQCNSGVACATTLTVTGLTTCSGGLSLAGTLTCASVSCVGNLTVTGAVNITGLTTCNGGLNVASGLSVGSGGSLTVNSDIVMAGAQPNANVAIGANTYFGCQFAKCYGVATWTGSSTIALDASTAGVNLAASNAVTIVAGVGGSPDVISVLFGTPMADAHYVAHVQAWDTINQGSYVGAAQLVDCDIVSQTTGGFTFTAWLRNGSPNYVSLTSPPASGHGMRVEWVVYGRM
jgi:hypothetical protein